MVQQQNVNNEAVGKTTVGDLSKVLTNEIGSLSTPKGGEPSELTNPQHWDRYTYTLDNPITLTDPTGMDACDSDNGACTATVSRLDNKQQMEKNQQAQQQSLAGTIYNETGSLRPQVGKGGTPDTASATSLSNGREAIGQVVLNRAAAGKTGGVAPSAVSKVGKSTSQYADSLAAAGRALAVGGSKTGPRHYYIRSGSLTIVSGRVTSGNQPLWGKGVVPAASYGPFRNPVRVGDVGVGNDAYIDIYDVP